MDFEVITSGFRFVEAPRIDDQGMVYFSDLLAGGFYRCRPGSAPETLLEHRPWIGGAVLDHCGAIVVSGKGGIALLDPATGATRPLLTEIDGMPIIAVNDMEADGRGGLFGGTIDFEAVFERGESPQGGKLFHLSSTGVVRTLRDGLTASNGLAFTADGRTLYHSESSRGIWRYPIGADGMPGTSSPELFAALDDSDGLVVDSEGAVWVACWQSAQIRRYRPDGTLDRRITLPFPHIVSLAFGGADLTDLYVATGTDAEHPGQGGIVRIKVPAPGLRPHSSRMSLAGRQNRACAWN
jgi:sugar lactone lactonase YvrE